MADDPTRTPTSDSTTSDPPAADPAPAPVADPKAGGGDPKPAADPADRTALGDAGDPPADPSADPAAKPDIPEAYELAVPEGFEKLDEKAVEAATPVFKELGLSNEQANKLMPVAAQFAKGIIEQRDQQFLGTILEQRANWLNDAKADKEIGGANWDGSIQAAGRALDRLGFPKGSPLRAALDESGFGNHPEMVRFFARAGKAIGEDTDFVRGDQAAAVKPKTAEETLWPGQGQKA